MVPTPWNAGPALRSLRCEEVGDRFSVGPPGRHDPFAEIDERLFGNVNAEGADSVASGSCSNMRWKQIECSCGR